MKYFIKIAVLSMLIAITLMFYYLPISAYHLVILTLGLFILGFTYSKKKDHLLCGILSFIVCLHIGFTIYSTVDFRYDYQGIDISKWNGDLTLDSTTDFVILRVGYTSTSDGTTMNYDERFDQYIEQCIDLGIPYGFYYYSCASSEDEAIDEANFVLQKIQGLNPTLGVFIDMEDDIYQAPLSRSDLTSIALAFEKTIEDAGYLGGVYANYEWWHWKLDITKFNDTIKWVARYHDRYVMEDYFDLHQYSDSGKHHTNHVDFDLNGTNKKYWE